MGNSSLGTWWRSVRRKKAPGPGRRFRPALESLEERRLLAAGFLQSNLVSDVSGLARFTDPGFTNPWGLTFFPGGLFWISANGAGASPLLDATGAAPAGPVLIPPGGGAPAGTAGTPTGTVFNAGPGFAVTEGGKSGRSQFLFATQDGTIAGWSPHVDLTHAVVAVDNSAGGWGAVYTGLALDGNASGTFLYAANFRAGTIDVFDAAFHPAHPDGSFTDPNLPAGFAPFNVQNLGGNLFVTYARQDGARRQDVAGPGNGFLDVFDADGHLLRRLASQGGLNSPWGLAVAPAAFGPFGNALLVGNFGDGRINAFDLSTGAPLGPLADATGRPLTIPNLWGLTFGGGGGAGDPGTLFFTAGIGNGQHRQLGSLQTPDATGGGPPAGPDGTGASGDPGVSGSARGGPGQPNSPAGEPTPAGQDDYPLPPPAGPALRGGVEGQPPPLPLFLPLKESSGATVPVAEAFAGPNPPAPTASPAGLVTAAFGLPGPAAREAPALPGAAWAVAAPAPGSETGPEPGPQAGHPRALDLLMELLARADAAEEPAVVAGPVGPPPVESPGWAAAGELAGSEASPPRALEKLINLSATMETPDAPRLAPAAPRAATAGAGHRVAARPASGRPEEGRGIPHFWAALLLAFGTQLAWLSRPFRGPRSGGPERRPRSLLS